MRRKTRIIILIALSVLFLISEIYFQYSYQRNPQEWVSENFIGHVIFSEMFKEFLFDIKSVIFVSYFLLHLILLYGILKLWNCSKILTLLLLGLFLYNMLPTVDPMKLGW
jgi:hypothetical protein